MDLGLLYSNFAMDNKDLTLHTSPDGSGVFRDTDGQTHCTIRPYNHGDPDMARDPFSTNRRLFDSGGIELFGSMASERGRDAHFMSVCDGSGWNGLGN